MLQLIQLIYPRCLATRKVDVKTLNYSLVCHLQHDRLDNTEFNNWASPDVYLKEQKMIIFEKTTYNNKK